VQRGGVEEVELRPVREHEAERLPTLEAEAHEPGGHAAHLVRVFAPGHGEGVLLETQRTAIGMCLRGVLKGLGHGGGVEAGRALGTA
jgi:hypothetical protein